MNPKNFLVVAALFSLAPSFGYASGHGPVFALATPTNPQGGFSFDTSFMGRYSGGSGTMFRGTLGYGITENLKLRLIHSLQSMSSRRIMHLKCLLLRI